VNAARAFVRFVAVWAALQAVGALLSLALQQYPRPRPPEPAWQVVVQLVVVLGLALWGAWILNRTKEEP